MLDLSKIYNLIKTLLIFCMAGAIVFASAAFLHILKRFLLSIGVVIIVLGSLNSVYQFISNVNNAHKIDITRYQLGVEILFGLE